MGRRRPFTVEMARRRESRTAADLWRRLVDAARLQARRASGEVIGVLPEKSGGERWALTDFNHEVARAPAAPLDPQDFGAQQGVAAFLSACRGFGRAGDDGRRAAFAPVLSAAADLVERLMDQAGVPTGAGRGPGEGQERQPYWVE